MALPTPSARRRASLIRLILTLAVAAALAACTTPRTPAAPAPPADTPAPTATAAPAAGSQVAGDQGNGVAFVTPPQPLTLPADAAPHHNLLEWWYYNGHLQTDNGRRFGFEFVVFQRMGKEAGKAGYVAHAAITDLQKQKFTYAQKLTIAPIPATKDEFALQVDDWSMAGKNGDDKIAFSLENYELQLALKSATPPVLHGGTGYIAVGEKEFSYYYSRPLMTAEGTLTVDGQKVKVHGTGWFDQQWGDMTLSSGGWDWFGIQLDDKSEIMVSNLRTADGKRVALYGTYVGPDGKAEQLSSQDIQLQNGGLWISPKSGGRYPMGWSIRIPRLGIDLVVQPELQDQELDTSDSANTIYWEGASSVQGLGKGGAPTTGNAYVELTGYAHKAAAPSGDSAGH